MLDCRARVHSALLPSACTIAPEICYVIGTASAVVRECLAEMADVADLSGSDSENRRASAPQATYFDEDSDCVFFAQVASMMVSLAAGDEASHP
jgi:hypothetical protein